MISHIQGISVDQFCRKHNLSKNSLFILAHSHDARIPDTVEIANRLRILDPSNKAMAALQDLTLDAKKAPDGLVDFLHIDALCRAFEVDDEMLLRLTLADDMPDVFSINGRAVFPSKSVVNWSLRKRMTFIEELIK